MHQSYVVILLTGRHSVARLSKTPPQLLCRVAMNIKMSSGNVLCQSGLEHSNSTNTLMFCSISSDLTVSEVQVKMHDYVVIIVVKLFIN